MINHPSECVRIALPFPGAAGMSIDIRSIISLGTNQIGIMCGDLVRHQMHCAGHRDGSSLTSGRRGIALSGHVSADNRVNLSTDPAGPIYAASKTAEAAFDGDLNLLISAINETWPKHLFNQAATHTRPSSASKGRTTSFHMLVTVDESGAFSETFAALDQNTIAVTPLPFTKAFAGTPWSGVRLTVVFPISARRSRIRCPQAFSTRTTGRTPWPSAPTGRAASPPDIPVRRELRLSSR